jgi:hypothetical protein
MVDALAMALLSPQWPVRSQLETAIHVGPHVVIAEREVCATSHPSASVQLLLTDCDYGIQRFQAASAPAWEEQGTPSRHKGRCWPECLP